MSVPWNRKPTPEELYEQEMGKPPPPALPADDPLAWQAEYRGTPEERARLLHELFDGARDDPPPVLPGQESLL